jgi:hypothetical protein
MTLIRTEIAYNQEEANLDQEQTHNTTSKIKQGLPPASVRHRCRQPTQDPNYNSQITSSRNHLPAVTGSFGLRQQVQSMSTRNLQNPSTADLTQAIR